MVVQRLGETLRRFLYAAGWAEQEARLNAELARQLAAANERASRAASIAQDSSTAKDRAQTLARQLASVIDKLAASA